MNIYQPVLRHNNFARAPDTHFARDTHMRIILGNPAGGKAEKGKGQAGQEPVVNSRWVGICGLSPHDSADAVGISTFSGQWT